MSYAFEQLVPTRWNSVPLSHDGPLQPVIDRVGESNFGGEHAALDCSRILMGLMEHKQRRPATPVTPELLASTTESVKAYLGSGDVKRLDGLRQGVHLVSDLGSVSIRQSARSDFFNALRADACVASAKDMQRRIGDSDALVIALGGSGILPAIQTAICRDGISTGSTDIYPVRFSIQTLDDAQPQVNMDELAYLKRRAADKAVVIYDDVVAWGYTMAGALSFFDDELSRPDIQPAWSHDALGMGVVHWPFPDQNE